VRGPVAIGVALAVGLGIGGFAGFALDEDDPPQRAASVSAPARECRTSSQPVLVDQDGRVFRHALDAIRKGHAKLLHKGEPGTSDRNRAAWKKKQGKKFPGRGEDGLDRDEYPPAMSIEGGADTDLRYIPSVENQAQGRELGKQMGAYCPGQAFVYIDLPGQ
jgi:Deoxyribonuclease NucA/NucB